MSKKIPPSSSPKKTPSTHHWWVQLCRWLLNIVLISLLLGIIGGTIANLNTTTIDIPLSKYRIINVLVTYPVPTIIVSIVILCLLIIMAWIASGAPFPPSRNQIMKWVKQGLYRGGIVLLVIVVGFLLVPLSLSPLTIFILIALGLIACIPLLIVSFFQIRRPTSPSKTAPGKPSSTPSMSRRSFLGRLWVNVGAAMTYGYLIARGQALLALLSSTTTVTVVYSTEKEAWLKAATDAFNQQYADKGIQVVLLDERGSLDAADKIVAGMLQPTVWSPASSVELHYLSDQWSTHNNQDIIEYTGEFAPASLVHSPLVFAVWQSRANLLSKAGYHLLDKAGDNVLGWSDLFSLLSTKRTWSAIGGDKEWGEIKFGQTQPDLSNSGLLSIVLLAYSYFRTQSGLEPKNIADANTGFQAYFLEIEGRVSCFGPSSGTYIDTVIQRGPSQFDIITTYENLILTKESEAMQQHEPLVMYYPATLNLLSDHPYAILRGKWVTSEQESAALLFRHFLLEREQQQNALRYGFRSSTSSHYYGSTVPITDPIRGNLFQEQPHSFQQKIKSEDDLGPIADPPGSKVIDALVMLWKQQYYPKC